MYRRSNKNLNAIDTAVDIAVKGTIREALIQNDWSVSRTALQLGVARIRMYRLVRAYKLMKPGKVMVRRLVRA